jgi:predicted unusual protein kinase regulating ubiquinone biosynthesis (AarF/ABC1/UbiB family)
VSERELPVDAGDVAWDGAGIDTGRVRRTAPLVGLTTRTAAEAAVVGLRSRLTGADTSEFQVHVAERYAELLGHSKGALMKAGQMFSYMSAPALPLEFQSAYQAVMSRLCDDAPPMAPELARAALEHALGRRAQSAFAQFDWRPLAAASIGQVHAARLHDGRAVAVKLQYPGAAEAIGSDLKNAELLATFFSLLGCLSPHRLSLDLRGAAREVGVRITEELDYRLEAANQAEFADLYRGHPFIHVPEVIEELSNDRVLTQELVRGRSFGEAVAARRELRDRWAEAICRFIHGSYHCLSMFHGDPHPGNFLFHDDGSVTFLDFGCVKRITRHHAELLNAIYRALSRGDVYGLWDACIRAGLWRASDPVTPEEAFAWLGEDSGVFFSTEEYTVTPAYAKRWLERKYSPTGPFTNALRHLTMPPEYALIGKAEVGMVALMAQLRATARWGAIAAEHFENADPLTDMGRRNQAFFAASGAR